MSSGDDGHVCGNLINTEIFSTFQAEMMFKPEITSTTRVNKTETRRRSDRSTNHAKIVCHGPRIGVMMITNVSVRVKRDISDKHHMSISS